MKNEFDYNIMLRKMFYYKNIFFLKKKVFLIIFYLEKFPKPIKKKKIYKILIKAYKI